MPRLTPSERASEHPASAWTLALCMIRLGARREREQRVIEVIRREPGKD